MLIYKTHRCAWLLSFMLLGTTGCSRENPIDLALTTFQERVTAAVNLLEIAPGNEFKTVAVLQFEGNEGNLVSEVVQTAIVKTGRFRVVEREELGLKKILEEQKLTTSDLFEKPKGLGQLVGCDALFLGKVRAFDGGIKHARIEVQIKLVHVSKGFILWQDDIKVIQDELEKDIQGVQDELGKDLQTVQDGLEKTARSPVPWIIIAGIAAIVLIAAVVGWTRIRGARKVGKAANRSAQVLGAARGLLERTGVLLTQKGQAEQATQVNRLIQDTGALQQRVQRRLRRGGGARGWDEEFTEKVGDLTRDISALEQAVQSDALESVPDILTRMQSHFNELDLFESSNA
jgi:hypothetical protein